MLRKICVKDLFLNHIKIINVGFLQIRSCSENIVIFFEKKIYNWILSLIKDL